MKFSTIALLSSAILLYPSLRGDFKTYISFDKSMNLTEAHTYKKRIRFSTVNESKEIMNTFRELYNKNCSLMSNPHKDPIIPKIIHQIWVGPNKPPAIFEKSQESIRRLHPDWEYKLWTDEDVASFGLHNQDLYDQCDNYGEKADIFRYEILHRYGGMYLDVDFICLKPLDVLHY